MTAPAITDCDNYPEGSTLRAICDGTAKLSARKINAYRDRMGLPPLDGLPDDGPPAGGAIKPKPPCESAHPARPGRRKKSHDRKPSGKPNGKPKGKCGSCGESPSPRPAKPNGWGPGSVLLKMFAEAGVPHCQDCIDLAGKMDRLGKRGCQKHLDKIVVEILPRAQEWMAENQPFLHRLFSTVKIVEDAALKLAIRRKVQKAIDKAPDKGPRPARKERKPRPKQRNSKTTLHRPDDKSNLISSTAIGQPTYTIGDQKTVARIPFTTEPTRNLIYHVWPSACDDVWRWNLDLLLEYIDLFNGRRIVAIVVDHEVDAEVVQDHLAGEVLEFMIFRNNPKTGEMVSFLPLLAQVESHDPNVVTFRAHAKGVYRICKDKKPHLREWVELLYRTNLGDWPIVREHLESAAITGACRKLDMFNKKRRDPSYSGSFYWFRNCFVFSREWYRVDGPRWGCESWPGKQFCESETRCLFLDETKSMYSADYWRRTVKPAYDKWLSERGLT